MATVVPLQPPPQYDVVPPVPVIEHVLSQEEINKTCGLLYFKSTGLTSPPPDPRWPDAPTHFRGCSLPAFFASTYTCEIWYINDPRVRRHELGHCNGWPVDHPGGHE